MSNETDDALIGKEASDGISVAPPDPEDTRTETTDVREAKDATDSAELRDDPSNENAKLDVALDETFPTSDPPSNTQPGKGQDPAPSSGYDPEAEAKAANRDH
jgi:hypothetical protein